MIRGLHHHVDLQSKLDAILRRWQNDWHALDMTGPMFTPAEELYLDDVKSSIEQAASRLQALIAVNAGKRTIDWK